MLASPAVMSHDSATATPTSAATLEGSSSFIFDSNDLDLSLDNFPKPHAPRQSIMSESDPDMEEQGVVPAGQELHVPTHPIPSMQAAFAESMLDVFDASEEEKNDRITDPATRYEILTTQEIGEETHAGRWKQKPGQRYHELWKLVAQISFGIYLLLNGMARDDDQALNILQKHVDEVDSFLESTVEDFDYAQEDIEKRLKNLKLPLENIHIFDDMLEQDRQFRNTIVEGNEKIEHIITRTAAAMNDSLRSVQQGMEATREFKKYMEQMEKKKDWQEDRPDEKMKLFEKLKLFDAMNGNADGWYKAFVMLQTKGNHLGVSLVQLGTIVAEIDKRAAEISRKTRVSISSANEPLETLTSKQFSLAMSPEQPKTHTWILESHPTLHMRRVSIGSRQRSMHSANSMNSRHSTRRSIVSITKDLPADPAMITPAIAATLPAFQMVSEREKTPQPEEEDETPSGSDNGETTLTFLTLEPRTYTPPPLTPSRYTPPTARTEVQPPTPISETESPLVPIPEKSSLRKRLSKQQKSTPPPLLTTATYGTSNSQKSRASSASSNTRSAHSRQRSQSLSSVHQHRVMPSEASQLSIPLSAASFPRPPIISFNDNASHRSRSNSPLTHHPLQARESGYYAPDDNIDSRVASMAGSPNMEYHAFIASAQPSRMQASAPPSGGNYISSPRSEAQMTFQPVLASPHSPLQRPWTAAENRARPGTSVTGNGHSYSANAMLGVNGTYNQGQYGAGGVRGSNMSQMTRASEMTVGAGPDGKKVKKKRSGFGWLKKAFSLSEEEKAEFERNRRRQIEEEEEEGWRSPRERQFLDGRRVNR